MIQELEEYFTGVHLTRWDTTPDGKYHRYVARLAGWVLVVFVRPNLALIDSGELSDIAWDNIQTRSVENIPKADRLPIQKARRFHHSVLMWIGGRREQNGTYYEPSDGDRVELLLLHDQSKKSIYQYYATINMTAAFETRRCVISRVAPPPPPQPKIQATFIPVGGPRDWTESAI